jgi:hypothetical protein
VVTNAIPMTKAMTSRVNVRRMTRSRVIQIGSSRCIVVRQSQPLTPDAPRTHTGTDGDQGLAAL